VFISLLKESNLLEQFVVESRGTSSYHKGEKPDSRTIKALKKRNIEVNSYSSPLSEEDLLHFDYVVCMDSSNLKNVLNYKNAKDHKNIFLYSELIENFPYTDVPDPYFGSESDFDLVNDIVYELGHALLLKIRP